MDEKLREEMIRLYMAGRYDGALALSRKLDKQILEYTIKNIKRQDAETLRKKNCKS